MASQRSKPKQPLAIAKRPRGATLALGLALIAATFAAHFPAVYAGYTWDDASFLYESPLVISSDGIYKSWFTTEGTDYWPLMSTMFWIEWRMWGNNPMPFHVANIALHAMSAVALWRVLKKLNLGDPGAYIAGAIFAVHPVTVESVAWIAERKNVLSMFISLLAILAYLRFEDRPSPRWYLLAFLTALAAILAKSSAVMLPIVLLLCAWWRRGRITLKDLLRTLPFFTISLVLGLVEVWFVHNQAARDFIGRPEGVASKIAATGWIIWFYLYKLILPVNLAMIYPRWNIDGENIFSYLPLTLLLATFVALWIFRKSWGRAPLAAMAYFSITLLPVIGLLNMQYNAYSLVADHLQYPAMPTIVALIGGGIAAIWARARREGTRKLAASIVAATGIVILTLGILTWRQARIYRDEITLWSNTIEINDRAWAAYNHRGKAYYNIKEYDRAIRDYTAAINLEPNFVLPYNNRGNVYTDLRDYDRAFSDYRKSIELKPDYADTYCNRAAAYNDTHDYHRAIADCDQAIKFKPGSALAYNNRGNASTGLGLYAHALADYLKAVELNPDFALAHHNLAVCHFCLKQYDQAWPHLERYRQLGGEVNPEFLNALTQASASRMSPPSP